MALMISVFEPPHKEHIERIVLGTFIEHYFKNIVLFQVSV